MTVENDQFLINARARGKTARHLAEIRKLPAETMVSLNFGAPVSRDEAIRILASRWVDQNRAP